MTIATENNSMLRISQALPGFVEYMRVERRFSAATVNKYEENLLWFVRQMGDFPISELGLSHIVKLKSRMAARGVQEARIASMIFAIKSLLGYGRDVLQVPVLDLSAIKSPRLPRRQVVYLAPEELERFIAAICLTNAWSNTPRLTGFCFRALVETLCASAMRISEALALDRGSIDFEKREARIVGKGNRERTTFFTEDALRWIRRYLDLREDNGSALFATRTGERLKVDAAEATFRRVTAAAGLEKKVTPHVLRHTVATSLLQRGCPVGYIKEILGHQRLETTCHYYLGVLGKADTKRAFESYMSSGGMALSADPQGQSGQVAGSLH